MHSNNITGLGPPRTSVPTDSQCDCAVNSVLFPCQIYFEHYRINFNDYCISVTSVFIPSVASFSPSWVTQRTSTPPIEVTRASPSS